MGIALAASAAGATGVDARAAPASGGTITLEQIGAAVAGKPFRLESFVDSDSGTAMSYKVTLSLPAGIEVVKIGSPFNAVPCTRSVGSVTCSGKTIGSGATDQILYDLRSDQPGRFTFKATLEPDVPDSNPADNAAELTVAVAEAAVAVASFHTTPLRPVAGRAYQATLLLARGGTAVRPTGGSCRATLVGASLPARRATLANGVRCS